MIDVLADARWAPAAFARLTLTPRKRGAVCKLEWVATWKPGGTVVLTTLPTHKELTFMDAGFRMPRRETQPTASCTTSAYRTDGRRLEVVPGFGSVVCPCGMRRGCLKTAAASKVADRKRWYEYPSFRHAWHSRKLGGRALAPRSTGKALQAA